MLPIITLIFTKCLLDVTSSPVYNMQPAYITANIGTIGRNIRNLPCISRRSNQNGVCMFAIDCLKANGTHLGTCIDRFYFGSCCHMKETHEILDNSIDSSIFPVREPPLRLSTTEKMPSTIKLPDKVSTVVVKKPVSTVSVTKQVSSSTSTTSPTTTKKILSTMKHTVTPKIEPTSRLPIVLTKEPAETTENYKLTTFQSVDGVLNDITTASQTKVTTERTEKTTINTTTAKPTSIKQKPSSAISSTSKPSSISVLLVTKPIVTTKPAPGSSVVFATTPKPSSRPATVQTPSTSKSPTPKPTVQIKLSTSRPPTVEPALRPTTVQIKPLTSRPPITKPAASRPTYKPIRTTTLKPSSTTRPVTTRPTQKPLRPKPTISIKPTAKPVSATKLPTKQPIRSTTRTPLLTTRTPSTTQLSSSKPTTVTTKPLIKSTTVRSTIHTTSAKIETTSQKKISTPSSVATTTVKVATIEDNIIPDITTKHTTEKVVTESTAPTVGVPFVDILLTPMTKPQMNVSRTTEKPTSIESNEVLNVVLNTSSAPADVSGNIITNEIETVRPIVEPTTRPTLVTWTSTNEEPTIGNFNTTDEDWVPITTPDGWVLLPSVSSTTGNEAVLSSTTSATTSAPEEATQAQTNYTQSEKEPITTSMWTPETSTKENNYTQNVTESLETTSIQVDVNITEDESVVNMTDFTDVCGRRMYPKARIVGGENSSFGKWPWQISLRQWRTSTYLHKCGAALLNENWAITAAHCVDTVPPSDLLLRLGEHDLSTESEPYLHQERRVQIVASHPQFDPRTFEYDLALLRFYEPVKFQPNILPVCVPQTDDDFIESTAYVTGWGRLYEDGPLPSILQEVSVPVINNTLCESMYRSAGYIEHIPHIFICAGWRRGGFDSCEGDSGGPMVIERSDKRFLLAGVISWGIGCAEPNQPGVYTRISEFRDWINQILQF